MVHVSTILFDDDNDPSPSKEPNLIHHYPLDDGYEEICRDLAGTQDGYLVAGERDVVVDETLTITDQPWYPTWRYDMVSPLGRFYPEMNLTLRPELEDKTRQQGVEIPDPSISWGTSFTVHLWFRMHDTEAALSSKNIYGTIFSRGTAAVESVTIKLNGSGGMVFQVYDASGTLSVNVATTALRYDLYWQSVTIRYDSDAGVFNADINGVNVIVDHPTGGSGVYNTGDQRITLGNQSNGTSFVDDFSGCISGVRVYDAYISDGLVQFLEQQIEHNPAGPEVALHSISHRLGVYEYQSDIYFQGIGLDDNPVPAESYGAMYELNANYADTFGNFVSMIPVEPADPILFRQFGSRRNAYLNGSDQRIDTDTSTSGFDMPGLVGFAGNGDWTLSAHFWIDSEDVGSLPASTYLLFTGYSRDGSTPAAAISLILYSDQSVALYIKYPDGATTSIALPALIENSWYRFVMVVDYDSPVGVPVLDPAYTEDREAYGYTVKTGTRIWVNDKLVGLTVTRTYEIDDQGNHVKTYVPTYSPPFSSHSPFTTGDDASYHGQPISLGAGYDMLGDLGSPSTTYIYGSKLSVRRLFLANKMMSETDLRLLSLHPRPYFSIRTPGGVGIDYSNRIQWVYEDRIRAQIPQLPPGNYTAQLGNRSGYFSLDLPFSVQGFDLPGVRDTAITYLFTDEENVIDNWECLHRQWGGQSGVENGGVIRKNVALENGSIVIAGHGDDYDGPVQGAEKFGSPSPHKTRTGAAIASREYFGPGRFDVWAKFGSKIGVAYALWLFHYEEIYPEDPRWDKFLDEGLSHQGTAFKGYYIVRNHELDFPENPSTLKGYADSTEARINYVKFNSWRGELSGEYNDNFFQIADWLNDGEEHKHSCEWWTSQNDVLVAGDAESDTTGFWWTMTSGSLDRDPYEASSWSLTRVPIGETEEHKNLGLNYFVGVGQASDVSGYQEFDLPDDLAELADNSNLRYKFEAYTGGFGSINSHADFTIEFLDSLGDPITGTTENIAGATAADRGNVTGLIKHTTTDYVPSTTRKIKVTFTMVYDGGTYSHNTAFWDDAKLTLHDATDYDGSESSLTDANFTTRRRTRYLIDDLPVRTIYGNDVVPYIPMKLTLGLWFPSAGDFKWAGTYAAWKSQKMRVSKVQYTPYDQTGRVDQVETYPRTGYANIVRGNVVDTGATPYVSDDIETLSFELDADNNQYYDNPITVIYDQTGGWQLEKQTGDSVTISSAAINGYDSLVWGATTARYISDNFQWPLHPIEVVAIIVAKIPTSGTNVYLFGDNSTAGEIVVARSSSNQWTVGYTGNTDSSSHASASDGNWHVIVATINPQSYVLRIDGTQVASGSLPSAQSAKPPRWSVGWNGAEITYGAVLNNSQGNADAEALLLEEDLLTRYGL